ncbi:MAG: wax ester/triacylglycerol synthase family O-acyltransferase [Deltaproteobacteria bacterium]|nr:wax ester/triacylglycerol synthase family O-acyltransferase [Deltaproteobacteria bacterium]MBW2696200.1 wax ester/triacylglycerol synthase family O-acyltransferase [Deltaproteobacteria bacterium]
MMSYKRLSGLDTVFLAAESPGNWLHVMAILILDPRSVPGGYSFDRFRDYVAKRLHLIPPMRCRLVEVPFGLAPPIWVDDPELDIDRHLRRAAVPPPGGPSELARLAAEMMERPLDRSRPLWEISMVEGVEGGQIALLAKLHHSMMDGMAGMQFMAALLSREPDISDPDPAEIESAEAIPSDLRLLADAAPNRLGRPLRLAKAGAQTLGRLLKHRLADRSADEFDAVEVPRMWLNAPSTPERSVSYISLPLDTARGIAHAHDATLNDVILSIVGGALRCELDRRDVLPDAPLVAAVPVSTHDEGDDLANAVSVMYVRLGTDVADPIERLHTIRDDARRAKHRQGSLFGNSASAWADAFLPYETAFLAGLTLDLGLLHHLPPLCNLVVSNIPGPPVPLYLGGARLMGIHPLGPIFDGMALNITVLSREDETLDFGLVALGRLIRDPWPLANALKASLEELSRAAGVADEPSSRSAS